MLTFGVLGKHLALKWSRRTDISFKMSAPAFGFSVGDFLAAVGLIIRIGNALRKSTGAKKEFRRVIDQFRAFQTPLLYIKLYAEEHREEIEEMEEKARLREMLRLVQTRIDDMLEELDKFQEHLAVDVRVPLKRQPKAIAIRSGFLCSNRTISPNGRVH